MLLRRVARSPRLLAPPSLAVVAVTAAAVTALAPTSARAQGTGSMPACPAAAAGCASADISYDKRVGLPIEFDVDTGWWPSGSPVQVRFQSALQGHTEVRAAGVLQAAWPDPMQLRAFGTPGSGSIETDYGIVLDARVRLHLDSGGIMYDWEGSVPYVPMIDFRAMASTTFDPWAWNGVSVTGSTMRQHLADIPLTDAFISIPGVSGGLSFDAQADVLTFYRSTRISFGTDADPLTASVDHVMAVFTAGPSVDYFPRLEGHVDQTINLKIYPSIYVSLAGRRWMVDLFELPVDIGPIAQDWVFDPSQATMGLPDVTVPNRVVDFGDVFVGTHADATLLVNSVGLGTLVVTSPPPADPFGFGSSTSANVAPGTNANLPVTFFPTNAGRFEQRFPLRTNDPDTPVVYVTLRGNGVDPPDAGPDDVLVADASDVVEAGASDVVEAGANDAGVGDAGMGDAAALDESGNPVGSQRGGCGCSAAGSERSESGSRGWGALVGAGALATAFAGRRRRRGGR